MRSHLLLSLIVLLVIVSGCHTSTTFMLPPNTDLVINGERATFDGKDEEGHFKYESRPFFWTSVIGIEYMLVQDGKVVKKDRLPSSFRVASIFWPPYAMLYWPFGFSLDCYDLSDLKKEFIEKCPTSEASAKGDAQASKPKQ